MIHLNIYIHIILKERFIKLLKIFINEYFKKIKNYVGDYKICQNITSYISGDITIFCYHKVTNLNTEKLVGSLDEDLSINVKIFENQIKYLVDHFKIINPYDLMDIDKLQSVKEKKSDDYF